MRNVNIIPRPRNTAWLACLVLCLCLFALTPVSHAQSPNNTAQNVVSIIDAMGGIVPTTPEAEAKAKALREANAAKKPPVFLKNVFLSDDEVSAIQRALLGVDKQEDTGPKPPRLLRLSGLLYKDPNDWVIWLNGNRLTPDRLLPEIIEITVDSKQIYLKWFDYGINNVIFITLRPHQIYDMETGILLPG